MSSYADFTCPRCSSFHPEEFQYSEGASCIVCETECCTQDCADDCCDNHTEDEYIARIKELIAEMERMVLGGREKGGGT